MFNISMTASFQHVRERDEIRINVGMRVCERISHTRLGCQVDNAIEPLFDKQFVSSGSVGEVLFNKSKSVEPLDPRQSISL